MVKITRVLTIVYTEVYRAAKLATIPDHGFGNLDFINNNKSPRGVFDWIGNVPRGFVDKARRVQ